MKKIYIQETILKKIKLKESNLLKTIIKIEIIISYFLVNMK